MSCQILYVLIILFYTNLMLFLHLRWLKLKSHKYLTCTSNQEISTEAQGFPLRDVFLARERAPPEEIYNINKGYVTLSCYCMVLNQINNWVILHMSLSQIHNEDGIFSLSSEKVNTASHLLIDAFQTNMSSLREWDMMKLISDNFSHLRCRLLLADGRLL